MQSVEAAAKAVAARIERLAAERVPLAEAGGRGVAGGDRDHVRTALAAAGVELELWKVAMKPGKPFSCGMNGRVPVFGLPGNPISTYITNELFVKPALLALQGA